MSIPDAASSNDQDGQVEPLDSVNDPADANVDNNVIPNDDENIHAEKDESSANELEPTTPITPATTMPLLTNLADLTLHSPSSMIVGTPFSDANSTRFEYPFPDKSSTLSSPELSSSNSPPHNSPTFSSLSPSPSSSALVSTSQPQLVLNTPPTLQHFPASFPPPPDLPNYSPTHPKLRAVDPPVPPALVKRRQRWTLGLGSLSRKISLRTGSAPAPVNPSGPDSDAGHRRTMSDERASGSKGITRSPAGEDGPSVVKGAPDDYT
ncbi:hypothetical protein FB451DRAFT_1410853 [Mycena latifolia]|nr:hypothetical protein FB451DRAFT_1410853 [Mycena latifolia]